MIMITVLPGGNTSMKLPIRSQEKYRGTSSKIIDCYIDVHWPYFSGLQITFNIHNSVRFLVAVGLFLSGE